jgi:hypothetical protein
METKDLNLEPLGHNVYAYTKIIINEVLNESDSAIKLRFSTKEQSGLVTYIPKSQCRIDNNGNIWITKWLEERL